MKKILLGVLITTLLISCSSDNQNLISQESDEIILFKPKSEPTSTPKPEPTEIVVKIIDFMFDQSDISIYKNSTITWINYDSSSHTASSLENKFDSGYLNNNQHYSFKFLDAGIYTYRCNLHPSMRGEIRVLTKDGKLIDPTPAPRPTSTPNPNRSKNDQNISPPQSSESYY